ncbi:leucine-rich repeat-containing protein 51-like [Periplaneta americana]|uniref:leucine-rich repeat-containing protein 51-like n=1 Tax=Periplaneta americana TaxID=6978 RepID=UPI0037E7CE32
MINWDTDEVNSFGQQTLVQELVYLLIMLFSDLKNERPRVFRVGHMPVRGSSMKYLTRSVWLNNNNLTNARGFENFINSLLEQPSALGWIDLSFNTFTEVDDELLKFPNLRILYLHGNSIQSLGSIEKLKKLDRLLTATFHGNPIESMPCYRSHIINLLPQINNLDFAPVVSSEREAVPPQQNRKRHASRNKN